MLTPKYDVVARFQGGPNAGHTLEFEGQMFNKMNKTQRCFYSVEKFIIEEVLFDLVYPNNGLDLDQALTIERMKLLELKNSNTVSEGIKNYAQFGLTAIDHIRRRLCI